MSGPLITLQLRALMAMAGMIAVSALLVAALPGAPTAVRATLAFRLQPQVVTLADAVSLAATNAKAAGLVLLGALAARDRVTRTVFDVLLTVLLAGNMAIIGAALGAYGPQLLPWLVHLPLELAALAVPAAAYVCARSARLRPCRLLATTALTVALLAVAALVETYLTPHV